MPTTVARRVLFAVCALQLGCGNHPPTAPTVVPPQSVVLTGRVLETTTGDPVRAANVFTRRPGESLQPRGTTDDNGAFQFADLKPGNLTIVVAKIGYERTECDVSLMTDTSLVFLVVPRRFALSGRVSDFNGGSPLGGATITVLDGDNASRTTVTGADGTFRLPDLWFGGFTIRVRQAGYDSVFRGIRLAEDTALDVELRRAEQSLAGTWTGVVSSGPGAPATIPEVTLSHSGATVAATNVFGGSFSGTLRDPARIGSTTEITGTLTWTTVRGPARGPITCRGVGSFTGTVNWTQLRITAPRVVYDCADVPSSSVSISLVRQQ